MRVDLHRGIDGHHVVVTGDQAGIVGIGRGMKLEDGIVVDKLEQPPLVPSANPRMILRGLKFLRAPVTTPA